MMLVSDYMCYLATALCSSVGLDLVKRTLEETVILPSLRPEVCVCVCVCACACACVCACVCSVMSVIGYTI